MKIKHGALGLLLSVLIMSFIGCSNDDAGDTADTDTSTEDDCEEGTWRAMDSPVNSTLDGVWGSSPDDVWAVGQNGVILHFDGKEWTVAEYELAATLDNVQGTSQTDVWAAGWDQDGARIYHYDGISWSQVDPGFSGRVRGLYVASPNSVWVMGIVVPNAGGFIWHFDGNEWSQIETGLDQVQAAWGPTEDLVYFVGEGDSSPYYPTPSQVERYENGATEVVFSIEETDFESMFGIAGDDIYLTGDIWSEDQGGSLGIVMQGDGTDFTSEDIGLEVDDAINDLWGDSAANLIAVGPRQTILHRRNGIWHSEDSGTSQVLNGVWGFSNTEAFAVGHGGAIVRLGCELEEPDTETEDYDWQTLFQTNGTEFYGIWGADSSDLYISSTTGVWRVINETEVTLIWPETNGGRQNGIWGASDSDVFSVGSDSDGMVRVVRCTGGDCNQMDTDIEGSLEDVHAFSETDVFAVGYTIVDGRPVALAVHYDGNTWQPMPIDSDTFLTGIWGAAPDDIWASGWTFEGDGSVEYGRLLHYDGNEWSVAEDFCDTRLYSIRGSSAGTVYAAGQQEGAQYADVTPFGLAMGFDGSNWQDVLSLDDRGFDAVWVASEDEVYLASRLFNPIEGSLETEVLKLVDDTWEVLTVDYGEQYGDPFEGIWGEPGGPLFAITRDGSLLKYDGNK